MEFTILLWPWFSKTFPAQKAARILMSRTIKNIGTKLGVYDVAYLVFGVCEPPEFEREHF